MGHESQIELWTPLERRSALLVSELTGFVAKRTMKTAGGGNPNRWAQASSNLAHGALGQKPSHSFTWAAKQQKFQPLEGCFFLTSPFIELHLSVFRAYQKFRFSFQTRTNALIGMICSRRD